MTGSDLIIVNELEIHAPLGASHWPKPGSESVPQPLSVTARASVSVARAGVSDALADSVNYSSLAKTIEGLVHSPEASTLINSLESFAEAACITCLVQFPSIDAITIIVAKKRALLHAERISYELTCEKNGAKTFRSAHYQIRNLRLSAIIGIHPWERAEKQVVLINLSLNVGNIESGSSLITPALDYRLLVTGVSAFILGSAMETVEALVSGIAQAALVSPAAFHASGRPRFRTVSVRLAKPSALIWAESAEIEITRAFTDYALPGDVAFLPNTPLVHRAVLALGSNLGDRVGNIEKALSILETHGIRITNTSFMYESAPMYVTDQPQFSNAACTIETSLSAVDVLHTLKNTEEAVGRTQTYRNGPRVVDLDIVFYDDLVIDETPTEDGVSRRDLTIPHRSMLEREFVLRPVADLVPDYRHPLTGRTVQWHLNAVTAANPHEHMVRIISLPSPSRSSPATELPSVPPTIWPLAQRTYVMGTLNVTPDSFSDGGLNNTIPTALDYARAAVNHGADIIDVGGYSTRPGASEVTTEEEISRVVPVIRSIREAGITVPISIDTFRPAVALAAVQAGANCINDVRGLREPGYYSAARSLGVPVIMMHSRGHDASADKDYGLDGVMNTVCLELGAQVSSAIQAGVRRWNIIVDPGIGFSKTVSGNLEMIQGFPHNYMAGMPVLVGTSRKSYLGAVIKRPDAPASERDHATVAAAVASIQQGCDIIRVHDVLAGADAAKVADALYR
ncbi:Dihydropteroate synthase, partial [Clavulina sp. PMI_390]